MKVVDVVVVGGVDGKLNYVEPSRRAAWRQTPAQGTNSATPFAAKVERRPL